MSTSLLPEAMQDSVRIRRFAFIGALAVFAVTAFTMNGLAGPTIAEAQSESSCGGPEVLLFNASDDVETACTDTAPAFCPDAKDADKIYSPGSAATITCISDYKEADGVCPKIGQDMQLEICSTICCTSGDGGTYVVYDGQCEPADSEAAQPYPLNEDGSYNLEEACGATSSSSSSSSSSAPNCGNGQVDGDGDEQCDSGSYCVGGTSDGFYVASPTEAQDCVDGDGGLEVISGGGCDDSCQLEDMYCCDDSGQRVAIDQGTLETFAANYAGDTLEGYECSLVDSGTFPPDETNLTTTDPDASCACGNGIVEPQYGEECDLGSDEDGNSLNTPDSGCEECISTCGNGVVDEGASIVDWGGAEQYWDIDSDGYLIYPTEECDDGNWEDGDGCDAYCQTEKLYCCFAGERQEVSGAQLGDDCAAYEGYGEASDSVYDSCDCGDGIVQANEDCDLGEDSEGASNNLTEYGCTPECKYSCGDGSLDENNFVADASGTDWVYLDDGSAAYEQCDDGNLYNNDGCDENCQIEAGLCCYAPSDWAEYGYFDYESDIAGDKVDQDYCDSYGGTYYAPEDLVSGQSYYEVCEIPGICCPSGAGAPFESLTSDGCYGDFMSPESLESGDYYGYSYDENSDGSYDEEEASRACNENGVCCYDENDDGTNDTYDYPTDEYDVDREYCDQQGGTFTPLSGMDPTDPAEYCGIQGVCCYTDDTNGRSTKEDCDNYEDQVYDQNTQSYVEVTGKYVSYDAANVNPDDYELTQEEMDDSCTINGLCCYDDDGDGTNDSYDDGVSNTYCAFFEGEFTPEGTVDGEDPAEYCGLPGVCCYDDYDPEQTSSEECDAYQGVYHPFGEANTNGDYVLQDNEITDACEYKGVCCIDLNETSTSFETYREDLTEGECNSEWSGEWTNNKDLPSVYTDGTDSLSDYCPIDGVCCPNTSDSQSAADPFRGTRYDCYDGHYVTFDDANTDNDDEISDDEISAACEDPGYCCKASDYEYDEVYGADECTTPGKFVPTADAIDADDSGDVNWDEACALYCCTATGYDEEDFPYGLDTVNISAEYPGYDAEEGDDCQDATGDENALGTVSYSDSSLCSVYCCEESENGDRNPVQVDDQYTNCEDSGYKGGDDFGYPTYNEDSACDYTDPVVCCTISGSEQTFYDQELEEGDNCADSLDYLSSSDCTDPENADAETCYQDMEAVLASDRSSSSAEPICQLYCCGIDGEPYGSVDLDPYEQCDQQYNPETDDGLSGGVDGYPSFDKNAVCPEVPTWCCTGGDTPTEATGAKNGNGDVIKPGDDCIEFGEYNDFPASNEEEQEYACDYFCCEEVDGTEGSQVEINAEDYNAAVDEFGTRSPSCKQIGDMLGATYADKPIGEPTDCADPLLFCCEGDEGGPTGPEVIAYDKEHPNRVGAAPGTPVNSDEEYETGAGCYGPNIRRDYTGSDLTCCQADPGSCGVGCADFTILYGIIDVKACNETVCANNGCEPTADNDGLDALLMEFTDNPWDGGLICNACNAESDPVDDVYVCDDNGGSVAVKPIEAAEAGVYATDNQADADEQCQLVYFDEGCVYPATLVEARKSGATFYTFNHCSLL